MGPCLFLPRAPPSHLPPPGLPHGSVSRLLFPGNTRCRGRRSRSHPKYRRHRRAGLYQLSRFRGRDCGQSLSKGLDWRGTRRGGRTRRLRSSRSGGGRGLVCVGPVGGQLFNGRELNPSPTTPKLPAPNKSTTIPSHSDSIGFPLPHKETVHR